MTGEPARTVELAEARRWLARELHDGAVQTLTGIIVELEELRRVTDDDAGRPRLDAVTDAAREVMDDLRRVLSTLRAEEPAANRNLTGWIHATLRELSDRCGVQTAVTAPMNPVYTPEGTGTEVRRIVGEALANAGRHSGAEWVQVTLQLIDDSLAVTVSDDGDGYDPGQVRSGWGIRGMHERALLIGARLTIDSRPGAGTDVRLIAPARLHQ